MSRFTFLAAMAVLFMFSFLPSSHADQIAAQALADKSDRVVIFYDETGEEMLRVKAAFGINPGRKNREGDKRTPEGDYMMAPARPSNDWVWFMHISYPNQYDVARAQSEGRGGSRLGGQVGMHATGDGFMHQVRQSFGENWTLGCIAIANHDMDIVRTIVRYPIPIRIQP
jgi:murein L,D-transpeptidase YafK